MLWAVLTLWHDEQDRRRQQGAGQQVDVAEAERRQSCMASAGDEHDQDRVAEHADPAPVRKTVDRTRPRFS
jgi:hypothetical protein